MTKCLAPFWAGGGERNRQMAILKVAVVVLLAGALFSSSFAGPCLGYLMPAEQVVSLMGRNFEGFKSFKIVQLTQQDYGRKEESLWVFREELIMKAPGFFRSRILDPGIHRGYLPDSSYRELFLANDTERLIRLMSRIGIETGSVGFTRLNGAIAYRIGDKWPGEPKMLVEKDRFLPLKLVYRPFGAPPDSFIKVVFEGYRRLGEGWYPFQITLEPTEGPVEVYVILDIGFNLPSEQLLFPGPPAGVAPRPVEGEKDTPDPQEERLRSIIRSFEEKYQ
ncbi:MAG: hypothetical protein JRJ29_04480 [Deltaproteobacteria bacterium]|nr:hypothetical protein [Deltaproteobacteria bacterium]